MGPNEWSSGVRVYNEYLQLWDQFDHYNPIMYWILENCELMFVPIEYFWKLFYT